MWGGGGIVEWGRDAGVSKDAETRVGFAGQEVGVAKTRHSGGFGIGSCMCWSRTKKGRLPHIPSHYSLKELAKKINSSPSRRRFLRGKQMLTFAKGMPGLLGIKMIPFSMFPRCFYAMCFSPSCV
jgi:hypothetical protein